MSMYFFATRTRSSRVTASIFAARDETLSKIVDFYDDEVDAAVGNLLSLLEPMMIVFLGVVVGGMVVSMYLPIFDMINAVQ